MFDNSKVSLNFLEKAATFDKEQSPLGLSSDYKREKKLNIFRTFRLLYSKHVWPCETFQQTQRHNSLLYRVTSCLIRETRFSVCVCLSIMLRPPLLDSEIMWPREFRVKNVFLKWQNYGDSKFLMEIIHILESIRLNILISNFHDGTDRHTNWHTNRRTLRLIDSKNQEPGWVKRWYFVNISA